MPPPSTPAKRKPAAIAKKRPVTKPARAAAKAPPPKPRPKPRAAAPVAPEESVVKQMRQVAGKMIDIGSQTVGAARTLKSAAVVAKALRGGSPIEVASEVLRAVRPTTENPNGTWAKTGAALRSLREAAGLTIDEVGQAVNLKDPAVIEALESGLIAVPFELILRLAAVLGRKDPVAFVMEFTRSSNPEIWSMLDSIGFGKLLQQTAREREFMNIYRGCDEARKLKDDEFDEVLKFTQAAFKMAVSFGLKRPVKA